jgi:hypothetical protein
MLQEHSSARVLQKEDKQTAKISYKCAPTAEKARYRGWPIDKALFQTSSRHVLTCSLVIHVYN